MGQRARGAAASGAPGASGDAVGEWRLAGVVRAAAAPVGQPLCYRSLAFKLGEVAGDRHAGQLRAQTTSICAPSAPSPSTSQCQMLVASLDGRRRSLRLPASLTLPQLQAEVQQRCSVPTERQRLAIQEQRALGRGERLAWALLRLLLATLIWAAGWLVVAGRWLLGLPPAPAGVRLQLTTSGGRAIELEVSADTTLAQLQALVLEQHGEQLYLRQMLSLSPTKGGGGAGGSSGGGSVDGGGGARGSANACASGGPAWRRLFA